MISITSSIRLTKRNSPDKKNSFDDDIYITNPYLIFYLPERQGPKPRIDRSVRQAEAPSFGSKAPFLFGPYS